MSLQSAIKRLLLAVLIAFAALGTAFAEPIMPTGSQCLKTILLTQHSESPPIDELVNQWLAKWNVVVLSVQYSIFDNGNNLGLREAFLTYNSCPLQPRVGANR